MIRFKLIGALFVLFVSFSNIDDVVATVVESENSNVFVGKAPEESVVGVVDEADLRSTLVNETKEKELAVIDGVDVVSAISIVTVYLFAFALIGIGVMVANDSRNVSPVKAIIYLVCGILMLAIGETMKSRIFGDDNNNDTGYFDFKEVDSNREFNGNK